MKHWKLALGLAAVVLLLTVGVAVAMQTTTYTFTASSADTVIPITTYRDGDILAVASFKPSSHGMYHMEIQDAVGHILCYETYDFRWGRTPAMPMTCNSQEYAGGLVPAGSYSVFFRASMGGRANVTLSITAETDQ